MYIGINPALKIPPPSQESVVIYATTGAGLGPENFLVHYDATVVMYGASEDLVRLHVGLFRPA
jgi:hypothetical protein